MVNLPPDHLRAETAERLLIGDLLRDPDRAVDAALQHLDGPEDFHLHAHAVVFAVCRDLYATAKVGGPHDVYQELVRRGQAADVGGAAWLLDAWEAVPTAVNAEYHAKLVREASLRRRLRHTAAAILAEAENPPTGSAEEAISGAGGRFQELLDAAAGRSSSVVRLDALLSETLTEVDARYGGASGRVGLSSGFRGIDGLTGGYRPGQLIVIGARPGDGKTAVLLAMLAAASAGGSPTFLASLEMARLEIGERLLAMGANVKLNRIRSGRGLDAGDIDRLAAAAAPGGHYSGHQMYVDDTPNITAAKFAATVRTLVRRKGVKLAAVDYLQLLQPADKRDGRVQQVAKDTRELKLLARQCGIPIIAPCQLNRAVEARAGDPPRLSDLRECGSIEQDADIVMMLHIPRGQAEDADPLVVEVYVQKNRSGPKGKVSLSFRRAVVRFENAPIPC